MSPISRDELSLLLRTAAVKPRLRRELRFVPEEIGDWGSRDFLAVMNRSRSEGVMIAARDVLRAVPFRLDKRAANPSGRVEAIICDICATWQRGTNSAVITFQKGGLTVSFLCCGDLLCSSHVRGRTPQAQLSRMQLREDITSEARILRLKERLGSILESVRA